MIIEKALLLFGLSSATIVATGAANLPELIDKSISLAIMGAMLAYFMREHAKQNNEHKTEINELHAHYAELLNKHQEHYNARMGEMIEARDKYIDLLIKEKDKNA